MSKSKKWTSFLVPQAAAATAVLAADSGGSDTESAKSSRKSKEKKTKKENPKDALVDKYPEVPSRRSHMTPYTKALLALTPGNHYTYEDSRWRSYEVLELLKVRLLDEAEIEDVVYPSLPPLEIEDPEVHGFLQAVSINGATKSNSKRMSKDAELPLLWKQCLYELKHYVETDPLLALAAHLDVREPLIKTRNASVRDKGSKRSKPNNSDLATVERPLKPIGSLAGANRPLVINFLRAICNEFTDCLAFEDLRYAWTINMYGHRRIRIGAGNQDRIKVNMREDICWRATKDPVEGMSPRDWTSKKRGLGPLFAVITKDWDEFMDVKRSALADLKTLLTILQDRRREAAYTTSDDITSRDSTYFSYVISVAENKSPCVSVNTLAASGRYLAYMERGERPPKGEGLVYRKGKVLSLVDSEGRIEFARIMMGLLGRVCTKRETQQILEPKVSAEENESNTNTERQATGGGGTLGKLKKSWFKQSLIANPTSSNNKFQGKALPKVTDWMSTLEIDQGIVA